MSETVENKVDYIPQVRAMVKLSSALTDADEVTSGKYFKYKFKGQLTTWISKIERATKPFMDNFHRNSEEALQGASNTFADFSDCFEMDGEDKMYLILLYCKCKSALNDMKPLSFEGGGMVVHIMIKHTKNMIECLEGQYGEILKVVDTEGKSIQVLIDGYDELGNTMFVKD